MLRKIRIISTVGSILVILLIGNSFFLNLLIYNKHLICNRTDFSFIHIIDKSQYHHENIDLFEFLKISEAELIICLNCDTTSNSQPPSVIYLENIKELFNEKYTALNFDKWHYYLDMISYNNTTIEYSSPLHINYCGQLNDFTTLDLESGLRENMSKVTSNIIIVVDKPNYISLNNNKVLAEVVLANGFYTILFNNYLSYTTAVALIIGFIIFWFIRLTMSIDSNSTKKNIFFDTLFLIGLVITSYLLLSLGLLIDYLLIILLISLSIIIEHLIYINQKNKSFK